MHQRLQLQRLLQLPLRNLCIAAVAAREAYFSRERSTRAVRSYQVHTQDSSCRVSHLRFVVLWDVVGYFDTRFESSHLDVA